MSIKLALTMILRGAALLVESGYGDEASEQSERASGDSSPEESGSPTSGPSPGSGPQMISLPVSRRESGAKFHAPCIVPRVQWTT